MRQMKSTAAGAIVCAAAHSRIIQPGEVVDFDEPITPGYGANYSLETALGPDAEKFAPHVEPAAAAGDPPQTAASKKKGRKAEQKPAPADPPAPAGDPIADGGNGEDGGGEGQGPAPDGASDPAVE